MKFKTNYTILIQIILLLSLSCTMDYSNPVDPEAPNYQGYTVVEGLDEIEAIGGDYDQWTEYYFRPTLYSSLTLSAEQYHFQILEYHSEYSLDDPPSGASPRDFIVDENSLNLAIVTPSLDFGSYMWRVRALGTGGETGQWSETKYFHQDYISSFLVHPYDNSVVNDSLIDMRWETIEGAAYYEFQTSFVQNTFDENRIFNSNDYGIHISDWTYDYNGDVYELENYVHLRLYSGAKNNQRVYWRVRAVNANEERGPWSSVSSYLYQDLDPEPLSMITWGPSDGTAVDSLYPSIQWTLMESNVESYTVELIINNQITEHSTTDTQFQFYAPHGSDVSWRVRANYYGEGQSSWTDSHFFSVNWNLQWAGISPFNGSRVLTSSPILHWDDIPGVAASTPEQYQYVLEMSSSPLFDNDTTTLVNLNDSSSMNFILWTQDYSVVPLANDSHGYWRITPMDENMNPGPVSPIFSFHYKTPELGEKLEGGHVFSLVGSTCYIVSDIDHPIGVYPWSSPANIDVQNANGTDISTGWANTFSISETLEISSSAAKLCREWDYYGYDDWFLPSSSELQEIESAMRSGVIPAFYGEYWSSSQYDANQAYYEDFSTVNGVALVDEKSLEKYIRPIRSVHYH